jgi:transcription initiation factor IIE alpha subunit
MTTTLSFDEAVRVLRKFVKYSEVKNQKHIDLSLAIAEERPIGQKALMVVKTAVEKGELTEDQLKVKLGLD